MNNFIGALTALCLFLIFGCNQKEKNIEDKIFKVNSLGYVTDTVILKSIMYPILPSGFNISDVGYKNFTKKYLKFEIKNCSVDTVYLEGYEVSKYPIDTMMTNSVLILGVINDSLNSFDSIIRPNIVKDNFTFDNIVIKPNESIQKFVEDDTEFDLSGKKLKLLIRYKVRKNDSFIKERVIIISS